VSHNRCTRFSGSGRPFLSTHRPSRERLLDSERVTRDMMALLGDTNDVLSAEDRTGTQKLELDNWISLVKYWHISKPHAAIGGQRGYRLSYGGDQREKGSSSCGSNWYVHPLQNMAVFQSIRFAAPVPHNHRFPRVFTSPPFDLFLGRTDTSPKTFCNSPRIHPPDLCAITTRSSFHVLITQFCFRSIRTIFA
jgi:hypothetical protein